MRLFACLAFLHGSGGAYGGDGIMNTRRFAMVAAALCGTVVLAGWVVAENTHAVPIEDRAASLAATIANRRVFMLPSPP